jgi:hypothetical protein
MTKVQVPEVEKSASQLRIIGESTDMELERFTACGQENTQVAFVDHLNIGKVSFSFVTLAKHILHSLSDLINFS